MVLGMVCTGSVFFVLFDANHLQFLVRPGSEMKKPDRYINVVSYASFSYWLVRSSCILALEQRVWRVLYSKYLPSLCSRSITVFVIVSRSSIALAALVILSVLRARFLQSTRPR